MRDETLAEDLVSDVFLDVWRQAASFEARSSVSTWLLAMGRYKALSALRRRRDVELDDKMALSVVDRQIIPKRCCKRKILVKFFADAWRTSLLRTVRS